MKVATKIGELPPNWWHVLELPPILVATPKSVANWWESLQKKWKSGATKLVSTFKLATDFSGSTNFGCSALELATKICDSSKIGATTDFGGNFHLGESLPNAPGLH